MKAKRIVTSIVLALVMVFTLAFPVFAAPLGMVLQEDTAPDLSVLATLGVILLLAFLVESLTEYVFGQPFDHIPTLTPYKWLLPYAALIVGVLGSWLYKFDLLVLVGTWLGVAIVPNWLGITLTGLAIGRGATYIHDLIGQFFGQK